MADFDEGSMARGRQRAPRSAKVKCVNQDETGSPLANDAGTGPIAATLPAIRRDRSGAARGGAARPAGGAAGRRWGRGRACAHDDRSERVAAHRAPARQRRRRASCASKPRVTLLDALRETLALDRHQERLRPRPVRRLHRAGRRPSHQLLPDARGDARGQRDHDHRRPRHARSAASDAGGVHRPRRLPVRLLHAGPDLLGGRRWSAS